MDQKNRKQEIEKRLSELETEKRALLDELQTLNRSQQDQESLVYGTKVSDATVSIAEEKVNLFFTLFACRTDVFPKLWENKTKKTKGYAPVCSNEWQPGVCNKPKVKCSACKNRIFIPLDLNIIQAHLEGRITIGTYAIREDDTCIFLAVDFDKSTWWEDAVAFKVTALSMGITAYIERSRSGNGAHVWIFFSEPVPALVARQLGTIVLSRTMLSKHTISLDSYDRFFPNQDYLPKGGFGNLIALPLQRMPRNEGKSVFVDDDLASYADQWKLLSGMVRLSSDNVSELLEMYNTEYEISGFTVTEEEDIAVAETDINVGYEQLDGCFRKKVEITLTAHIRISLKMMPSGLITALKRTATFANPKYFELQRLRYSTWRTPKYIFCGQMLSDGLIIPRGTLESVCEILQEAGAEVTVNDDRIKTADQGFAFTGALREEQSNAVEAMSQHDFGVLVAPTGSGKTVMACALIAQRDVPTLILVHRENLLEQWKERLSEFLGIDAKNIGVLSGKKKKPAGMVDIAMLQTLSRMEDLDSLISSYGHMVIDECQHIPAVSFENVINRFPVRYCLGLTATPYRKDGHQPILYMQCGPVRHEITEKPLPDVPRHVIVRETSIAIPQDIEYRPQMQELWNYLVEDETRRKVIIGDIVSCLNEGRFLLVLSERIEYLEKMNEMLTGQDLDVPYKCFMLIGGLGEKTTKIY
jgi:hypothetical protein